MWMDVSIEKRILTFQGMPILMNPTRWSLTLMRIRGLVPPFLILLALALIATPAQTQTTAGASPTPEAQQGQTASATTHELPRGKKLMLKDGGFQLVREYQVQGDRVKYYSLDRSQWEEIPSVLVDWDATKKAAAEEGERDAVLNSKVHLQEEGRLAEPLDIDASLEAAPGVFLPPGEGLFVFDGKTISPLTQAETDSKINKKKEIERVLVPIPIIPSRHTVLIRGPRSKLRVPQGQTEFYMRTADGREPEMNLIRAKVHGDAREIANVDELFKEQAASANTLLMQRWEIAKGVYRFTLGQTLEPGEYALAEIVEDNGMSIYVWDFGVDVSASRPATKPH